MEEPRLAIEILQQHRSLFERLDMKISAAQCDSAIADIDAIVIAAQAEIAQHGSGSRELARQLVEALEASSANAKAWQDCVAESAIKRTQLMAEIGLTEQQRDAAIAERDQLRAENERLRFAAADRECDVTNLTAERDQLRAEVDKVKEQRAYWESAAVEMRGYKEAAERERDEAWKMAHSVRETLQDVRNQRDAAQAHAEDLRGALECLITAAECIRHWHDTGKDNEGMIVSSEKVRELWVETEKARAISARTPAQSLARVKAAVLREFAKSREVEVVGSGEWYAGIEAERIATVGDMRDTADRLEKESTNATN